MATENPVSDRNAAIEGALNELVSNQGARDSWRTTLERLYDDALAEARQSGLARQRVGVNNIAKNVDRMATDLHSQMSELRDLLDS